MSILEIRSFNNHFSLLFTHQDRKSASVVSGDLRMKTETVRLQQLSTSLPHRHDNKNLLAGSNTCLFLVTLSPSDINKRSASKRDERNKSQHDDESPGAQLTSSSSICCLFDATQNDCDSEIFMLCGTESKTNPREKEGGKKPSPPVIT